MSDENIKDNAGIGRDKQGRFLPGVSGNPEGGNSLTPEQKLQSKAVKEYIQEHKDRLAKTLPLVDLAVIEKAIGGDVPAIKEVYDRVMGKPLQPIAVKEQIELTFTQRIKEEKLND